VNLRILTVVLVLLVSTLSIAIALPLAELLNLDLSELQGSGFNPTVKTFPAYYRRIVSALSLQVLSFVPQLFTC